MSIVEELRSKASRDNRDLLDRAAEEIEDLERNLEAAYANIERLQRHNTEVAFKHYNDGKKAVLSTIFADITKEIGTLLPLRAVRLVTGRSVGKSFELGREKGVNDVIQCLAKVEKKYTEEAAAEVPEKDFFTPEDVRNMSPKEVRKNYSAIMKSMKEW